MTKEASGATAGRRVAFVHISGLCWTFFGYHLLVQAKRAGILLIDRPVSTVKEQIAEIERLLGEGLDVLLFRPMATDDAGLLATLHRAQAQGVHLISIDGMPGDTIDTCSVTADNFGGQATLAEYVFERMGAKGKVAYLQGDLKTDAGMLRDKGLKSVLPRFPGIDLVYAEAFDWSSSTFNFEQGKRIARNALAAHPNLDAIISATDEGALGVNAVLEQTGLSGKILVAGFDGMPEGITAVNSGEIEVTARQPLDTMAQIAFELALDLLAGEVATVAHHVLKVDLVTRANVGAAAMRALRIFPEVTADLNQRATEQKNSATFLEALLDLMPTMVLVKEPKQLRYVRANRARDEWLNTPRGSQLGKTVADLYPAELAEQFTRDDFGVLASGVPMEIPEEESFREGVGMCYTRTRKIPVYHADGTPDYLMVISEDITKQLRAKRTLAEHAEELERTNRELKRNHERLLQAEKMAALGALVAGVSHELNTPIGNALMAVTTFADHTRSIAAKIDSGLTRSTLESYLADANHGLDILLRNLRRSAELIQSFKQIAIDQTNSQARTFSLAIVVAEVLLSLSPTLKKTPFFVQQDIPPELVLDSFPGPLEQVLMNLINNAVIHGFEGRSSGIITLSAQATVPGWIELVVQDDGVGIAPEFISRIFDPFFSTKFGQGSSGLGLSLCSNIVTNLLGGQIAVSSTLGSGTRFALALPLQAGRPHDQSG